MLMKGMFVHPMLCACSTLLARADEVIESDCRLPQLAPLRHADRL
jgi:hypothetical protein